MKKNFTLTEMIITIVILGIVATLGIPFYNKLIEDSKAKVCELNLKVLLGAVEACTSERNSFPASLSMLSNSDVQKAWAKVFKEEGFFKVNFAYFMVDLDRNGLAYAATEAPWIHKFIGPDNKILTCPKAVGPNSYGVNANLVGKTYSEYQALVPATLIVGDCASNTFQALGDLDERHIEYHLFTTTRYAQVYNKGAKKIKKHGSSSPAPTSNHPSARAQATRSGNPSSNGNNQGFWDALMAFLKSLFGIK